jgi:hypothetical protein
MPQPDVGMHGVGPVDITVKDLFVPDRLATPVGQLQLRRCNCVIRTSARTVKCFRAKAPAST